MIAEILMALALLLLAALWFALGAVLHWLYSWQGVDWTGDTQGAQLMRCLDDARFWVVIAMVLLAAAFAWLIA